MERVASPSRGRRMPCPAPHASQQPNCSTLTNPTQLPRRTPLRRAARAGAAADGHGAGAMAGEQWGYGTRALGVRVLGLYCVLRFPLVLFFPFMFASLLTLAFTFSSILRYLLYALHPSQRCTRSNRSKSSAYSYLGADGEFSITY
jgi:hypothetical protein